MENFQGPAWYPVESGAVSRNRIWDVRIMLLKTDICIYAVFDLTNYSIFTDYDIRFAIADTLWGGVLFVLTRYLMLQPSNIK